MQIAKAQGGKARHEILRFVSWVLYCACHDVDGRRQFDGMIPGDSAGCSGVFADETTALKGQFAGQMQALAAWMVEMMPALAATCLAEITSDRDAGYLLVGPLAVEGATEMALAAMAAPDHETQVICPDCKAMFYGHPGQDGYAFEPIPEDEPTGAPITAASRQRAVAQAMADRLAQAPRMAAYLRQLARFSCCRPLDAPQPGPDLFGQGAGA